MVSIAMAMNHIKFQYKQNWLMTVVEFHSGTDELSKIAIEIFFSPNLIYFQEDRVNFLP